MLKNIIPYRITSMSIDALGANDALECAQYVPCGSSQEKSIGWVSPRGEAHSPLLDSLGGEVVA